MIEPSRWRCSPIEDETNQSRRCLSNWNGFKLTAYERFEYIKGLKRQLERNPNDNGLIRQIKVQEVLYNREPEL